MALTGFEQSFQAVLLGELDDFHHFGGVAHGVQHVQVVQVDVVHDLAEGFVLDLTLEVHDQLVLLNLGGERFLLEEGGEVGGFLGDYALVRVYPSADYRLFLLAPVVVADGAAAVVAGTALVLLEVVLFLHLFVGAAALLAGCSVGHGLVAGLALVTTAVVLGLALVLLLLAVDRRVKTLEHHVCILALHEALVHFLHDGTGVGLDNAYVVDAAAGDLDDLAVHEVLEQLGQHAQLVDPVVLGREQRRWRVQGHVLGGSGSLGGVEVESLVALVGLRGVKGRRYECQEVSRRS